MRWPLAPRARNALRRFHRPAHGLEAVALPGGGGKDELRSPTALSRSAKTAAPSTTWSALLAAARAFSFGQPSRGSISLQLA